MQELNVYKNYTKLNKYQKILYFSIEYENL